MDFFDLSSSEENSIFDFLDNVDQRIVNKEKILASEYEKFFRLVTKDTSGDWHKAEFFIQELFKNNKYKEVYKHLYAGRPAHDEFIKMYEFN
ncbi:hypothetical protein DOK76_12780 [Vagococcus sp. DIV0080]|uniref:Uncharacterized protein n=1 Tax=Candidatus Vagococcus giribetii TaxID=2230876 RepID=A0ABS3HW80_9ENTE|nr:hypothetical protein [Vagococcus sp. DIV0080]MBO0477941.1 hypothetical protein [Vagococcus sp. DIV0080]